MKILGMGLIAAVLLLLSTPAWADWQYTRWGMSPSDVVAASGGKAALKEGTPGQRVFDADLGAVGTYEAMGFVFASEFYFDAAKRLKAVRLLTDYPRCAELRDAVAGIYGPNGSTDGYGGRWFDAANNNSIRLTMMPAQYDLPAQCFIAYSPINSTGAAGL